MSHQLLENTMRIVIHNGVCYIYKIDEHGREIKCVNQYPIDYKLITISTKSGNHSLDTILKAGGYKTA